MNPLTQLAACGQSPWLDYLTRSLVGGGGLRRMIDDDGLRGVTSNPSIFEKAIGQSGEYEDAINLYLAEADHTASEIYEHLAIADIQGAADILHPVFVETRGRDGYVSLECSPYLANDTEATLVEARRLWAAVGRDNLMVKVPGVAAGIPAIRRLIAEGLNINVTLLFSVDVYEQAALAYIEGLEDLARAGGDVSKTASVASIFVSRIDVAVDARLDALGDPALTERLRGKAAIANARLAYARYRTLFSGPRWDALAAKGARTQRLLWASTSTKNPTYRDTLYVEALIGPDTVDTLPPSTMDAFRDHGVVKPDAVDTDIAGARAVIEELATHGISIETVCAGLVTEGVAAFAEAFDTLFAVIGRRRQARIDARRPDLAISATGPGLQAAIDGELADWCSGGRIRRLWDGDQTLWTNADEGKWLGWLESPAEELADAERLDVFARAVTDGGYADVVLLGMGGSSLGPEVLGEVFGPQAGWPRFHMLDSTDPSQIRAIESDIDIARTMFIVSSKSGSTLEPNIFLDLFYDRVCASLGKDRAGARFVAVTDPGSSLEQRARTLNFGHIFLGTPSIGGRYSVLSKFGLAPAAAMGVGVRPLLEKTLPMVRLCGPDAPPASNPGVRLGVALGVAAKRFGRDKVTIITSPGLAGVGPWLEQLMAESTGKIGRGLIPLSGEPLASPDRYGDDRFFAYLELERDGDDAQSEAVAALEQSGHPVARIRVRDIGDVGQEFFRWEIATAVAAAIMGVNPFDQPDVEASKTKSRSLMDAYETSHQLPTDEPVFREGGVALYADPRNAAALGAHDTLRDYLKSLFAQVRPGDYVAVLAYIRRDAANAEALTALRVDIRDHTRAATCVGFGPRFQHSTGQAYKGGPNTGVFLQITCDDPADLDVPGHAYSFGVVKAAQARGDLDVLVERGRRALRIHLTDVDDGLRSLGRAVNEALAEGAA